MTVIALFLLSVCFTITTIILTNRIYQNQTDITRLKSLIDRQDAAITLFKTRLAKEDAKPTVDVVIESAGVDPNHQTDHCDHCERSFERGEECIKTCNLNRYLSLCRDCYKLAGSSVR